MIIRSTRISPAENFLPSVRRRNQSTRINNAEDAVLLPSQTVYKAATRESDELIDVHWVIISHKRMWGREWMKGVRETKARHFGTPENFTTIAPFTSLISRELCGKFLFDKLSTKVWIWMRQMFNASVSFCIFLPFVFEANFQCVSKPDSGPSLELFCYLIHCHRV